MNRKESPLTAEEEAKKRASELLLRLASERRASMSDKSVSAALTDDLVQRVLNLAWEHQWERSWADFVRSVRPLILEASQGGVLTSED